MSTDTYAGHDYPLNGQQSVPPRAEDHFPPDVPFGTGTTQVVPHEWASWILTAMRDHELSGGKPRAFSAWLAECVLANR